MKNLHVITPILNEFESAYIKVRDLENRVYSDEEVALLPLSKKQENEWKLRAKSAKRFEDYLAKNHSQSNLLEIGCGNGWFSHLCSNCVKSVSGVDLNKTELEQAARVFPKENLNFYYWDLFSDSPFENKFDVIVLNAVVQYFPDFSALLKRLKELLNPNGKIHFIDSPFYISEEIPNAKKRTENYYTKMGVPEMSKYYFHHNKEAIKNFKTHYKPSKMKQIFKGKDSPFGWYSLQK